jgi:hypothetical protein
LRLNVYRTSERFSTSLRLSSAVSERSSISRRTTISPCARPNRPARSITFHMSSTTGGSIPNRVNRRQTGCAPDEPGSAGRRDAAAEFARGHFGIPDCQSGPLETRILAPGFRHCADRLRNARPGVPARPASGDEISRPGDCAGDKQQARGFARVPGGRARGDSSRALRQAVQLFG